MAFDGRTLTNVGVLAAIVEGGNFARAADALGISASGVSRAVTRLEERVGVRLLDRNTRRVTLTDEGRRLYGNIGPLLAQIDDELKLTTGAAERVHGKLRVNADAHFSRHMFTPHLGRFMDTFPDLSLELATRDRLGDLLAEGFDVAVRFGVLPESSMVARKLFETRTLTLASPAYLAKHGTPKVPSDLVDHVCIQIGPTSPSSTTNDWKFRRKGELVRVKTQGRLQVNDVGTLLGAATAGVGIARVKAVGVGDLLREGKLVEVLRDWQGEPYTLHAVYPSRRLPAAKVEAFLRFVSDVVVPDAQASLGASARARSPR